MSLKLSLSCGVYDRTRALFDGSIRAEGIDLVTIRSFNGDDLFRRTLSFADYDVSELSLSNYIYAREMGLDYIALPVFPSRSFRHADIYINKNSGISTPSSMSGKKILVFPSYYVTAAVFQRAFLRHDYGFKEESAKWFASKEERRPIKFPPGVSVTVTHEPVDKLLDSGEIDVMMGPGKPASFPQSPNIARLFDDPKTLERQYFLKTGIFPIMHVIVVRKSLWEKNRWIAGSLIDAFESAKRRWIEYSTNTPIIGGLAWGNLAKEEEKKILGQDPYPYTIKDNRKTLEKLIEYCSEQAVMQKIPSVDELFVDNAV